MDLWRAEWFEVLCWCTLYPPPPAQKSRHQKPRKSHESDQRAQIDRPCIPDLFSLNSFNQNCYFFLSTQPSLSFFFFGFHFFLLSFFSSSPWSKLNIINHWHFFKTIFETFLVFLLLLCLQITLVRKIKFNCKLFFRERNSIQFGNSHKFKLLETCDKTVTKADKKSLKG